LPPVDQNLSVDQLFGLTVQTFNAKRLVDSERYCRALLKAQPNNLNGINASGLIAQQAGRHDLALEKFCRAIEMVDQTKTPMFQSLSTSLKYLGRYQESETIRQTVSGMIPEDKPAPFRRSD
jgi:predicted Zn-dependent protease